MPRVPATLSSFTLAAASALYDGAPHRPVVKSVEATIGSLGSGDYALTYWRGSKQTDDFTSAGMITVRAAGANGGFTGTASATFTIQKAPNPFTVKAKSKKLKVKTARAVSVKASKAFKIAKKGSSKFSYAKVKVSQGKKAAAKRIAKKFKVSSNGTVKVSKGVEAGCYKLSVRVTAKEQPNYKKTSKNVVLSVVVS